jgi:hypothetical protein
VDPLPRKAQPVHHAGPEVLDDDVGALEQLAEDLLALVRLHVQRQAALVAVEHREVEAVDVRQVAQLGARDVAPARLLDLDHVGAHPGEQLRAHRPGLDVGHVDDPDPCEGFPHLGLPYLYIVWFMVPGAKAF